MESSEQRHALIVDDEEEVRSVLHELFLSAGFKCDLAGDGREALDLFAHKRPPLTVTDVRMPHLDGLELLRMAKALDPDAAFLMLTGNGDTKVAVESLKLGAHDFLVKPLHLDEVLLAADCALERRQLVRDRRAYHAHLERKVEAATRDLEESYNATLEALGGALDSRDVGTEAHSRRVRDYSLTLARAMGIDGQALRDIEHGVLLHDIGKIGIPDSILLKPGPLTPDEWKVMRTHPAIGCRLIENIPFLKDAAPIVYHHHERWDGTGYPLGLRGEAIPIGARIFAVADALDAMTVDRPYSRAISFADAAKEIIRCTGTHFDPTVVEVFRALPVHLFEAIRDRSEVSARP